MSHPDYNASIATQCQEVARSLTYNAAPREAHAKHLLLEAARCIDSQVVRVSTPPATGVVTITNARGKSREMTWRERLAYWLLGNNTSIRP